MARTSTLTARANEAIVAIVLELPERTYTERARAEALKPRKMRLSDQLEALKSCGLKLACEPVNTGATIEHLPIIRIIVA